MIREEMEEEMSAQLISLGRSLGLSLVGVVNGRPLRLPDNEVREKIGREKKTDFWA
jgi:hypothetical protein